MNTSFSQAAERNKGPIYHVLKEYISEEGRLLEIGSGTGQHAVYMAKQFPRIQWVSKSFIILESSIECFIFGPLYLGFMNTLMIQC